MSDLEHLASLIRQLQGATKGMRVGDFADPNTNVVGNLGDLYRSRAGGAGTTLWAKESGAGTDTGWVGK